MENKHSREVGDPTAITHCPTMIMKEPRVWAINSEWLENVHQMLVGAVTAGLHLDYWDTVESQNTK